MKAAARQLWPALASVIVLFGCAVQPATGQQRLLPSGLPKLPQIGEEMLRHIPSGLALRGFDPVAYHLGHGPVAGLPELELVHDGAVWRFATAANRDAFRDAPEIYEPRFAGFDASAVGDGRAVDADPLRFTILEARLYFFRNEESLSRFVSDAALRRSAEANWPAVGRLIAR